MLRWKKKSFLTKIKQIQLTKANKNIFLNEVYRNFKKFEKKYDELRDITAKTRSWKISVEITTQNNFGTSYYMLSYKI